MTLDDLKAKGLDALKAAAFDLLAQKENLDIQLQAVLKEVREWKEPEVVELDPTTDN